MNSLLQRLVLFYCVLWQGWSKKVTSEWGTEPWLGKIQRHFTQSPNMSTKIICIYWNLKIGFLLNCHCKQKGQSRWWRHMTLTSQSLLFWVAPLWPGIPAYRSEWKFHLSKSFVSSLGFGLGLGQCESMFGWSPRRRSSVSWRNVGKLNLSWYVPFLTDNGFISRVFLGLYHIMNILWTLSYST